MNIVLIGYWPITDFKARAPSSVLPSASSVQRGIASSSHDHAGSAEPDGTLQLKRIVRSNLRGIGDNDRNLYSMDQKKG